MDNKELAEYIDTNRWLLNNGLLNDGIKNQLFMYGSIVHKEVAAVELDINVENKRIDYKIFVHPDLKKKVDKYKELSKSSSIWGMWKFNRMLKKEGNLNWQHILNKFVKDYCGPQWSAATEVLTINDYTDGYDQPGDQQPAIVADDIQTDQQSDNG